MIQNDGTGRYLLTYEATATIRRIPVERRGVSKRGTEWVLGGVLVEIEEEGCNGSAQLYLQTWDDLMVERLNKLGVGKRVRIRYHIETKEYYEKYNTSIIIDEIGGCTEAEDYLYGKK